MIKIEDVQALTIENVMDFNTERVLVEQQIIHQRAHVRGYDMEDMHLGVKINNF